MVKIDKVYTKGGDKGKTSLGDGSRVSKTDQTIVALANLEELNANLGHAICIIPTPYKDILQNIQNDLFDLGADIVTPLKKRNVLKVIVYSRVTMLRMMPQATGMNSKATRATSSIISQATSTQLKKSTSAVRVSGSAPTWNGAQQAR